MKISAVTYLVRNYDEAIAWFVNRLGFVLLEDVVMSDTKRWVRVSSSIGDVSLLLAKAEGEQQAHAVGNAAGGRVAYFLHTDDFAKQHKHMKAAGVVFRETPRHEVYGTVAVFEDLYGNGWDLIELK